MHLQAIKLRGFKSFPDAVEVRLEQGVAVVVGPNGSGKSNVSDALLWAVGSLSPNELRAEKPDDVLFAGSAGRKPVDSCQVELIFDNTDGELGELDFSEVSIARRLHRGGEGQYLINGAPVRRIDLIELLSDVGLGGGLRSVISQGRVDAVLGSKPHERRELVEEAAGLGRFKRRKHRAELKLSRVAIQVERARDLEAEVKSRLRPLALQATAAERAEKLGVEIAALQAGVAALDLAAFDVRLAEGQERRTAAQLARRSADSKLETLLAERTRAEEELADAAGGREAATASLYRLRSAGERLELRRESSAALLEQLRDEQATAATVAAAPGPSPELRDAALAADAAARDAKVEREAVLLAARAAFAALATAERADHASSQDELQTLLAERKRVEEDLARAAGGFALRGAVDRVALRRESAAALVESLREELKQAPPAEGPSRAELERAANEAEAAARAAARERDALEERVRLARERLAALNQSIAEREGLPPAARALAEAGGRLALSLLEVEPGAERAVAAALGHRAAAVFANDASEGLRLLERARTDGLGSLIVLLGRPPLAQGAPPAPSARPAAELVTGEGNLLDGIWLVDADDLLAASHGVVVTPEGHGYDVDRRELWFAGETAEAVMLGLAARRRALELEAAELDDDLARATQAAAGLEERARTVTGKFDALGPRSRALPAAVLQPLLTAAERLEAAVAIDVARFDLEADEARATEAGADLRRLGGEETELRRVATEAAERVAGAERELVRLGGDRLELADTADDLAALRASSDEAAAGLCAAQERLTVAEECVREARGAYERAVPRRAGIADAAVLEALVASSERLDEILAAAAEATARFEAPLRVRADAGAARAGELARTLRELGAAEAELRRAATEAGERAGAIEVELARIDAEAGEARRRLEAAGAEPAEGDDRDALAATLERLERRRELLGHVNPLAQEEYEREQERLDELSTQRADLEASLDELETLRNDLAATVEQRFAETFEAVQTNFAEVAATLFPGGEGRLRLTEPEEGDEIGPGIEVELRPAGKRVTRLSLLSGGEKALGAISFLFSLFLAKPSPFYLLDEVEAALDDANIGRFVELLRRYADRAQFIVITHQKRTMEAADVLYGVTMGGDGVSQIVSRRLPREEAAAATA